jgi:hypothetical protein
MVDVVSRIRLLFQSEGGEKATKQTEKIGRAQTRLGQASASAGRQFSAQATGMGGLVTAYAGAAANIFAITMAFNALSKAARQEQTIAGVRTLATAVGESGTEVINTIQKITDGQLSMAETAEQANLALSAGFSIKQIEGLTKVATKASIALGRDLTDSMSRLVRGAAKVEPEILDELGIIVRLDKAVEKYAEKLGKAASSLSLFERSQAFTNEIIEQGESKFSSIDDEASTSIKSFEQLSAKIADLAQQVGGLIAGALGPVVDFITGNFLNTLSVAGILGGVIFRKLGEVGSQQLLRIATSAEAAGTKVSNFLGKSGAAAGSKALTSAMAGVSLGAKDIKGELIGMTAESRKTAISLLNKSKTTKLTAAELRKLNAALLTTKGTLDKLAPAAAAASAGVKNLGVASKVASVGFNMAGKGLAFMARAINLVLGALGKIFFIVSMVQLLSSTIGELVFGVDLFAKAGEKIGNFFKTFREESRITKNTIETFKEMLLGVAPLSEEAAQGLTSLSQKTFDRWGDIFLPRFLYDPNTKREGKELIDFWKSEFLENYESALADIEWRLGSEYEQLRKAGRTMQDELDPQAMMTTLLSEGKVVGLTPEIRENLESYVEFVVLTLSNKAPDIKKAIEAAIREGFSPNAVKELFLDGFQKGLYEFSLAAQETMRDLMASDIGFEGLADFSEQGVGGVAIHNIPDDAMGKLSQLMGLQDAYIRSVADGTMTVETFTKATETQDRVFAELIKQYDKIVLAMSDETVTSMGTVGVEGRENVEVFIGWLKELQAAFVSTRGTVDQFTQTMQFLNKSFDLTGLDKSREWLGSDGLLAMTAREFKENKFRQVVDILDFANQSLEKNTNQTDEYTKAMQALAVEYPNIAKGVEKLTKEIDKLTKSYEKQLAVLENRQERQEAQNELKLLQLIRKETQATTRDVETRNKIADTQQKTRISNLKQTLELEKQNINLLKTKTEHELKLLDIEHERIRLQITASTQQRRADLELERGRAQEFGGLYTAKGLQQLETAELKLDVEEAELFLKAQKAYEIIRFYKEEQIIKNKMALLEAEYNLQKQITNEEEKQEKRKQENLRARIKETKRELGDEYFATSTLPIDKDVFDLDKGLIAEEFAERRSIAKMEMDAAEINAQAAHADREIALKKMEADAEFLSIMTNALSNHSTSLRDTLNAHIVAIGGDTTELTDTQTTLDVLAKTADENRGKIGGRTAQGATGLFAQSDAIRDKQAEIATDQFNFLTEEGGMLAREEKLRRRAAIDKIRNLEAEVAASEAALASFENRRTLEQQHHSELIAGIGLQSDANGEAAAARLAEAELNLKNAQDALTAQQNLNNVINNQFTRIVNNVSESIQGRVSTAVRDLTTAMNEGTLTMDNFKEGFKSFIVGIMQDIQQAILDELVTKLINNMISEMANSLTSSGGGSFLSGLFASGGSVRKFAAGGVMQRDSVPALLEPGEFVIRKPMAKAIGGPALERMNATGQMPTGKVEVNMINKGTPQTAQVEQKPQVDGKGIVIDIVLKDLQNNGPIKQAIRGGGRR